MWRRLCVVANHISTLPIHYLHTFDPFPLVLQIQLFLQPTEAARYSLCSIVVLTTKALRHKSINNLCVLVPLWLSLTLQRVILLPDETQPSSPAWSEFTCRHRLLCRRGDSVFHSPLHSNVTPVWPPTGIAIASLLIFGRRVWPGIFLGALAANLLTNIPVASALGIAIGNTLEALVAWWLLQRSKRWQQVFRLSRRCDDVCCLRCGFGAARQRDDRKFECVSW